MTNRPHCLKFYQAERKAHFGHRETSSQIKSLIIYRLLPNYKEEVVLAVVVVAVVLFFNFALRTLRSV